MKIITLASRNIFRNRARTLVTTLAMAFACSIMIIYSSLMEGMVLGSERQAVIMNHGDIQIHAKNYRDDPDIYKTIKDSKKLLKKIRSQGFYATPRRYAFGLVASDESSSGIKLTGVDLSYEKQVTEIHKHVLQGNWLDEDDPYGVVIGKKLSRLLAVGIGSEIVYIGQTADGYMANEIFTVRGILKSVSASIDNSGIFISDQSLISLLALPEGAHEIAIMRSDRNTDLQLATQQIAAIASEYETLNWRNLMPVIARFLDTADVQILIMLLFTYIAVASVVLNAMLMSVFERIHEFGIMKAIGVTPWQTIKIIYAETLIITTLACVVGVIFGLWISMYFQTHGLDMSGIAGDISFAGIALDPIWYAYIAPKIIVSPIVFLYLISILAVIYPAIKIARIKAVDAIHYQ